jgi:hypothetical protein
MGRRPKIARPPKPKKCERCGAVGNIGNPLDRYKNKWICPECLNCDSEPARIEDYLYTGTSNLGIEI